MTTIDITGKTAGQLLAEARALLDQKPRPGELRVDRLSRVINAQWLITEADFMRVAALVEPERVEITMQQTTWTPARDAEGRPLPLPTTGDTTVTDVCPSRMITPEDRKIVHCDAVNHEMWANSLGTMHYTPGWQWSDKGAMPAEQPCDRRCAQCVERVRDAVIDTARRYTNVADRFREQARLNLHAAMREYEKVMGL